jgi:HTH-type transcriptional regulator, sugar sensing transcriptional regulator
MIEQILAQNGFNEKEAKIYLATLEIGEATIGSIANRTRLKRTTVYSVTEEMISKGILSAQKRRGVKRISALPPQVLIERLRHSLGLAESALPALLEMAYSSPLKPRVRFYEGIDGIKEVLLEVNTVKRAESGMIFTDYEQMPKEIFDFIRSLVQGRRETKNFIKLIVPNNPRNLQVQAEEERLHFAEHRIANFPVESNPIELTLFGNTKIGFLSFTEGERFAVVIDSKAIYHTLKNLFLLVWANAKPKAQSAQP